MKLSIIIVSYNVKHFLAHCLHAVMLAAQGFQAEIIVVDNNSHDGSIAFLQPLFPSVKFIENKENTGYAKANNQALAIAQGEYILYLNPDTLVAENALAECIRFLDEHKDVSATGVQMLNGNGAFLAESKRSFPSVSTAFYKLFFIEKMFPKSKMFGKYGLGFLDKNKNHSVDVLAGAFIMSRAALLRKIKGFDERYFMYGEDIDLSFALQQLGYKNYYLGVLPIIHFKGESTKRDFKYVKIFYNAMSLFVEKHYKGTFRFIFTKFIKLAIKGRALVSAILLPCAKKRKDKIKIENFVLFGDNTVALQAKNICIKSFPEAKFNIQHNPEQNLLSQKNTTFVFCINENLSYQKAIDFLKQNAPIENVFWFYKNAESLIGSSRRDNQGEVFY